MNLTAQFTIKVPASISVRCKNSFGDTSLAGIGGDVMLDSRFGAVDLRDIGGPVSVRAWGEFDLRAQGLRQGGTFNLQGSLAAFSNCAGPVRVNSFFGSVSVTDIPAGGESHLTGDDSALDC